jgi:hypothetical protein
MISANVEPEQRGRRDRAGFVLSLTIHAIVLTILIAIWPHEERSVRETAEQTVTITQRPITITKRRVAIEPRRASSAVAAAAAPAPAPRKLRIAALPAVAPLPAPAVHSVRKPAPIRTYAPVHAKIAFVPPHVSAAPPAATEKTVPGHLGNDQLAAIDRDLGAAIAADRAGHDPLAGTTSAPGYTTKQYTDAAAFTTGELRHGGLCDPDKSWQADGFDYYFVSCNVRFPDGTYEREAVPWPIRFKPDRDPFNGTLGHEEPLSMPLPGWTLPSGERIAKELRLYALDHGVQLPGD